MFDVSSSSGSRDVGQGSAQSLRRIMREYEELSLSRNSNWTAKPLSIDDPFEWHFTMRGPTGSAFEDGIYHGKILLPQNYPLSPPSFVLLNQNGRFEVGRKVCLSTSSYHPELWQPAWGLRTMLDALHAFFVSPAEGSLHGLDWSTEVRRKLALESVNWICPVCGRSNRDLLAESLSSPPAFPTSSSSSSQDVMADTTQRKCTESSSLLLDNLVSEPLDNIQSESITAAETKMPKSVALRDQQETSTVDLASSPLSEVFPSVTPGQTVSRAFVMLLSPFQPTAKPPALNTLHRSAQLTTPKTQFTFSERQVDNPYLQRKLKAKQELAQFFQELIAERTHQVLEESTSDRCKDRARLLKEFQEKLISKAQREAADSASYGESSGHPPSKVAVVGGALESPEDINPFLSVKETLKYAKLFREEFKLEKMPTRALLVLCEMLGLRPYRIRANIILQLRYHILRLQEEDREIMWEGVENLTHEELRDACRERAMRFYDVSDDVMRDQMTQWLTLSSHRDIPPLLLLWSRSITMTHGAPAPQRSLADGTPAQSRNIVNADELLPVIDASVSDSAPEEAKAKEDQIHEEFARIDRHLEALQETAKRLEEEHAVLTTATGTTAEDGTDDISIESYEATADDQDVRLVGSQTRAERTRLQKEALLKRSEKLEKEMQLLRTVTDLQHEQVTLLIRSLANLIDLYRSGSRQAGQLRHHRTLEAFVNRLEKTVSSFEEGVARVSNILEAAKCIRMSDEDAELYPSDTTAKPSGSLPETSSPSSGLGQEKLPTGEEQPHNATKHFL